MFSFLKQDTLQFDQALPVISHWLQRARSAVAATVCLENEHTCYLDTFPTVGRFLRQTAESNGGLRLAIDPCNHLRVAGTDGFEVLLGSPELLGMAGDVHVKDLDDMGSFVTVGDGVLRWPLIMEHLRRRDYRGFVTLECHLAGDLARVEASVRRVAAWL